MSTEEEFEDYPLVSQTEIDILMHRDAHFGGNFNIMLNYYLEDNKGVRPEFEIEKIKELALYEQQLKRNLASVLLSGADAEKVARAKATYKMLRELYEDRDLSHPYPLLIADLILSEEKEPVKEIAAIVREKEAIVPSLLELLKSEEMHDPLFPGYGLAPILAAKCLGEIGDKRAIISLFESLGEEDFYNEDILLDALKAIGKPAKEFLLHVVHARPLTYDNERAAVALIHFKEDPEVAAACLQLLQDPAIRSRTPLSTYLVLVCEGLTDSEQRNKFLSLAKDPATSKSLARDIQTVAKMW